MYSCVDNQMKEELRNDLNTNPNTGKYCVYNVCI